jgi:transglutaminase/protease-like cytokinesis protein 3
VTREAVLLVAAIALISSCTTTQIRQTLSDAKNATASLLHENGISVRNDPARSFDPLPYRTNVPDRQLSVVPPVMANQVFSTPEETLPKIVKTLISGIDDPVRQAKIFHDWVALNISYDATAFSKAQKPDQGYASVLRSRKAIGEGYSNLFIKMCSLADINCKRITGIVRSYGFDPISKINMGFDHTWNSVLLKGNWYLVDTTWDSCKQKGCGECTSQRHYTTDYFLLDPRLMLMTHFPTLSTWQLVTTPVSKDEFNDLPPLTSAFFAAVETLQAGLKCMNLVDSTTSISLTMKPNKLLMPILINDKGQATKGATYLSQSGDNYELKIAFPKAGSYTLILLTGDRGRGSAESTGALYFVANKGTDVRFPEQFLF